MYQWPFWSTTRGRRLGDRGIGLVAAGQLLRSSYRCVRGNTPCLRAFFNAAALILNQPQSLRRFVSHSKCLMLAASRLYPANLGPLLMGGSPWEFVRAVLVVSQLSGRHFASITHGGQSTLVANLLFPCWFSLINEFYVALFLNLNTISMPDLAVFHYNDSYNTLIWRIVLPSTSFFHHIGVFIAFENEPFVFCFDDRQNINLQFTNQNARNAHWRSKIF